MMVTKDRGMYGHEMHFIVHSRKHFQKHLFKLDNLFYKLSHMLFTSALGIQSEPC